MDQESQAPQAPPPQAGEQIPFGQIIFDNIWLLFLLGIAIPFLTYIVWGLLDIASTPVAPPAP